MNIIITSASRKVSLVDAFRAAVAQEGGGKIIAVDTNPFSAALYFADEHYLLPPSDDVNFPDKLLGLCKKQDVKLIVPTRDEELPWFAKNKKMFSDSGVFVMVPDIETVRICQDKKMFVGFCQGRGFLTPRAFKGDFDFPLFVKPRFGKGGGKAFIINSKEELENAMSQIPDAIVQEFINKAEYSIDLFADFSGEIISVIPRERIKIFGGESFVTKTTNNPLLIEESVRLAKALRLIGHNTIQCFLDGKAVKFIEVNPRFGGAAQLGFSAGAATPHFLVKLVKGEKLTPIIGKFKNNHVMLRYTKDLFLEQDVFNKGKECCEGSTV